jgi:hypothetical protein
MSAVSLATTNSVTPDLIRGPAFLPTQRAVVDAVEGSGTPDPVRGRSESTGLPL